MGPPGRHQGPVRVWASVSSGSREWEHHNLLQRQLIQQLKGWNPSEPMVHRIRKDLWCGLSWMDEVTLGCCILGCSWHRVRWKWLFQWDSFQMVKAEPRGNYLQEFWAAIRDPELICLSGANKLNVRSTRQMSSLSSFYKWLWSWSLQLHSQVWVSTKWNLSYPKQSPFSLALEKRTKAKKSDTWKTSRKDHGRGPRWARCFPCPHHKQSKHNVQHRISDHWNAGMICLLVMSCKLPNFLCILLAT